MGYNLLTCAGFAGEGKASALDLVSGGCIKARLGIVILFFIVAMIRKWGGEEVGLDFNFWFALIGAFFGYFIVITIFGSFKVAFIIAILLGCVGGYGAGYFTGSGD